MNILKWLCAPKTRPWWRWTDKKVLGSSITWIDDRVHDALRFEVVLTSRDLLRVDNNRFVQTQLDGLRARAAAGTSDTPIADALVGLQLIFRTIEQEEASKHER